MKKIVYIFFIHIALFSQPYQYEKGDLFDFSIAWKVITNTTRSIPTDFYYMATAPFEDSSTTLSALGVVGGLVVVDLPTTTFYQQYIENSLDFYALPTLFPDNGLGWLMGHGADSWLTYGLAIHYLGGFGLGDEQSQVAAALSIKAIAYSVGITHLFLKSITARERPVDDLTDCSSKRTEYDTCDPYDFFNFREAYIDSNGHATSMPSYHTTMFFSVARVYAEVYDNYWLPYIGLALLYSSNIKGHNHWVSDLVGGGIVGTFIGHQVVRSYTNQQSPQDGVLSLLPSSNGLMLLYRFRS